MNEAKHQAFILVHNHASWFRNSCVMTVDKSNFFLLPLFRKRGSIEKPSNYLLLSTICHHHSLFAFVCNFEGIE